MESLEILHRDDKNMLERKEKSESERDSDGSFPGQKAR